MKKLIKDGSRDGSRQSDDMGDIVGGLKLIRVNEYKIDKSSITDMEGSLGVMDKNLQSKVVGIELFAQTIGII